MDTENKEPRPAGQPDEGKKKRRRRGGRSNRPQQPQDAQAPQGGQTEQNTAHKQGAQNAQNAQNGSPRKQEHSRTKQRRRGGNGGGGNVGNGGYGAKWGLVDPYGKPREEDTLSLEELRARIVLKAADGSAPTAPHAEEDTQDGAVAVSVEPTETDIAAVSELYPMPDDPTEADETVERIEVVGIRFRSSAKVYYFDPKGIRLHVGDCAIVETVRGAEFGEVSFGNRMIPKAGAVTPLRPVLRAATEADRTRNTENREKEREALRYCQERVTARGLDMKLIDAQIAFDRSKLLIYFSSEGRVDFRELVRDLAAAFRTRIELRQIGIRDEAKMLGGLGACGRPLCCSTFLSDFGQVSIKMAKEQNLSLNSLKISGICGRLMCCLRYEADTYAAEAKLTPPVHATVKTADGVGTVVSSVPLAGTIKVALQDAPNGETKTYSRDEVVVLSRRGKAPAEGQSAKEQPRKKPSGEKKSK